jgi:hypothetical protein
MGGFVVAMGLLVAVELAVGIWAHRRGRFAWSREGLGFLVVTLVYAILLVPMFPDSYWTAARALHEIEHAFAR